MRANIEQRFTGGDRTVEGGRVCHDFQTFRQVEKGHRRLEMRTITVSSGQKGYGDWSGLEQVFQLKRRRLDITSGKDEQEIVFGVTSLSTAKASAARVLWLSRSNWGIESGLHQRRYVTFHEDQTRLTRGHAGRVMATLNNLAIGLLRHAGATNSAQARRWYAANITLALTPSIASSIK